MKITVYITGDMHGCLERLYDKNFRKLKAGDVLIVAGDFGSMMDDQNGEPAIKRILAKKDALSDKDRKAAEYYENYRYTWLEVQAVKAGVGLKCRDLLTGDDLFLMEMSASQSPKKRC